MDSPRTPTVEQLANVLNDIRHDPELGIDMIYTRNGHDVLGSELAPIILARLQSTDPSPGEDHEL